MKRFWMIFFAITAFCMLAADSQARFFRARGRGVNVNVGTGVNVSLGRRAFFPRRRAPVNINVIAPIRRRSANSFFNTRQLHHGNAAITAINGHPVGFNSRRTSAFGTRTFVDNVGRIFEVDAFGNTRLRGNAFSRGFNNNAFSYSSAFNNGFNNCFNNGFNSFGSCNTLNSFGTGGFFCR